MRRPPALRSYGSAFNAHDVADVQCAALPAVLLQIERVSEFHGPVRDRSCGIFDIDKKLDATLRAIDVLQGVRPYASGLVLACVAIYLWDTLALRIPAFQRRDAKTATATSLPLAPEPEEA